MEDSSVGDGLMNLTDSELRRLQAAQGSSQLMQHLLAAQGPQTYGAGNVGYQPASYAPHGTLASSPWASYGNYGGWSGNSPWGYGYGYGLGPEASGG